MSLRDLRRLAEDCGYLLDAKTIEDAKAFLLRLTV